MKRDTYDNYANSVDPDEMAHNEPSHQDLLLQFYFSLYTPISNKSCRRTV